MKLYATTTSERASKGQGGNKYIEISVQNEQQKNIFSISIMPLENGDIVIMPSDQTAYIIRNHGGGYRLDSRQVQEMTIKLCALKQKGEKQKGELIKCDSGKCPGRNKWHLRETCEFIK